MAPTKSPTIAPTAPTNPTSSPTTANPTPWATRSPTVGPTFSPTLPTMAPTTVSPTTVSPSKSALACLEKDLEKTGFKVAFDLYPTFHVGGGGGGGGGGGPKKLPRELSGLKMWGWDKKATAEDLENANKAPSSEKRKDQPDKAKSNLASVMVRVVHGDILDQRVEAITNAANEHLRHDAALAAAIAEAAGSEQLAQESQAALERVSLKPGGAVSTCSLALRSRGIQRIVHAVAPKFLQGSQSCKLEFQSAVMASLAEAESKQLTSLAIPLIGSGIFGWPTDLAAQLLTKKLVAWLSEHPTTSLREICLVDIDRAKVEAMVKGLRFVAHHGLHSSDSTTVCNTVDGVKHKQWQWTWSFPEKDKWVKYDEDQNVQLERAWHQHVANPSGVPSCRIMGDKEGAYSDSKHKPEGARGAVYDVFFADMHQKNVVSQYTRRVQRCQPTSPLPDIFIPANPGNEQNSISNSTTKVEVLKESAPNATDGWELKLYASDSLTVATAAKKVRAEIEANWTKKKVVLGKWVDVSFAELVAEGLRDFVKKLDVELIDPSDAVSFEIHGLGRNWVDQAHQKVEGEVRRLQGLIIGKRLAPPDTWTTVATDQPTCVEVAKDSAEWQKVVDMFNQHGFASTVKRVQRIENHTLWKKFARVRDEVVQENAGNANEKFLIHGTSKTDPKTLITHDAGIDPVYSGNGMYGRGSYFAEEADYSHNGYSFKEPNDEDSDDEDSDDEDFKGMYSMFLARVVCGKVDERNNQISLLHPKAGHHSVRGPVRSTARGQQFAYVLYRPYQSYPEYLVTYDK